MKLSLFVRKTFLIVILALQSLSAHSLNIICDLGDVAIKTNSFWAFYYTGMTNMATYLVRHAPDIHNRDTQKYPTLSSYIQYKLLFPFLNALPYNQSAAPTCDVNGVALPPIMQEWLMGRLSGKQVKRIIAQFCHDHPNYFASFAHKALMLGMTRMMFTPKWYVATRQIIPEMQQFLIELKNNGHKLYILSNWDRESFPLMQKAFPEFFALFDGYIISGHIGALKPDTAPYIELMQKYDLQPHECCMFDDRPENIATAHTLGMDGLVVHRKKGSADPDVEGLKKEFNSPIPEIIFF